MPYARSGSHPFTGEHALGPLPFIARGAERIVGGLPYRMGEIRYAVKREMALTLADLLIRRTHVAFQTRDHGLESAQRVAQAVADLLRWDDSAVGRAIDAYAADVRRIFSIDP